MSTTRYLTASIRAVLTVLFLALAGFCVAPSALAQLANPNPPERMSYQGFLANGSGLPLATNAPKNYDVIFRIYNDANAIAPANLIWSEQQSVTVDKGYYSILLGEGTQVGVEPHNDISSVFTNSTASDRYMEMTVKGIGTGGTDVKLMPRLRLLSSPYAYLARNAISATKLVTGGGGDLLTSSITNGGSSLTMNGGLTINGTLSATSFSGNLNASQITSGTLADARLSTNVVLFNAGRLSLSEQTGTTNSISSGTLLIDHENSGGASSVVFRSKVNRTSDYGYIQYQDTATVGGTGESARLIIGITNDADDHIALMPSGNVGIGKMDPTAKLQVVGDVKLGSTGQYFATSGEENLRIVRGLVSSSGTIYWGSGFTVTKIATGTLQVTFSTAFGSYPAVTVSPYSSSNATATMVLYSTSMMYIYTRINGALADDLVNFIAIGGR